MTTNIISNTPEMFKDEFRTPPEVVLWGRKIYGRFDFDTACTERNAVATMIAGPYGGDALLPHWHGVCWCNPPYSNIEPWIEKAISSVTAVTLMLIPSPNGEDRYAELFSRSHEINIVGRLSFLAGGDYVIKGKNGRPDRFVYEGEPQSGNTRGSSLFIINGYGQGSRSFITRDEIFARFGK